MIKLDEKTTNAIAKKVMGTRYGILLTFNIIVIAMCLTISSATKSDKEWISIVIIIIFGFLSSTTYISFLIQEYKIKKNEGVCNECKRRKTDM